MAYRPRVFTNTATAQEAVNYDKDRTSLVITNLSGETAYKGVDGTVAASGAQQGSPIFNNGRYMASFVDGRDPRNPVWLIGVAGGTIVIDEESSIDPYLIAVEKLMDAVHRLVAKIKA